MKNGFYFFVTGNNGGKREGFSIFLTVMLLSIILSIIFGLSAMIVSQHKLERAFARNFVIYYAAETGIEKALYSIFKEQQAISHIYQETLDNGADYTVYIYCCLPGAGCDFAEGDCPVYHNGVQMEKEDCSAKRICVYSTGSYLGFKKSLEVEIDQVDRWTGEGGGGGGTFTCGNNFIDQRDGNTYATVQIGGQCWMAENLAYLPSVAGLSTFSVTDPYYYVYGYDGTDVNEAKSTTAYQTYGVLYNWTAAMDENAACNGTGEPPDDKCLSPVQGACPLGWHIPSHYEWTTLEREVCEVAGGCDTDFSYDTITTGERGTYHESSSLKKEYPWPNSWGGNNSSGFTALPAGYYIGDFYSINQRAYFWSSTENSSTSAWFRKLWWSDQGIFRNYVITSDHDKESGQSIRCIKD